MLRVTFDTNVLDLACRPQRFPKDPRQPQMQKVHDALVNGQIRGFYSVTMLTIEGVMRQDRAKTFAGTHMTIGPETTYTLKNADLPDEVRRFVGTNDLETINWKMSVRQPSRKPLHPEVIKRMQAAETLGVRVLHSIPRLGAFHITDPTDEYYLNRGEGADLESWTNKVHDVAEAIEARGVGIAKVKALGQKMGRANMETLWYRALDQATDIHQRREVERAFSEWADGDSVAAHVAYDLDIFCSADTKNEDSIFSSANRAWLTTTYDVKFMTIEELAASLS